MGNTALLSPLKQAFLALEETQAKIEALRRAKTEPIAIIGMGCRFPAADNPSAFWDNLRAGMDSIRQVPPDRWDVEALYDPDPSAPGKTYTRWGGFLDRVDRFDPQFFAIAPREAASIEPQQRLLLEVSWEALEDAGKAPGALAHTRTGVFVGIANSDFANLQVKLNDLSRLDAYYAAGVAHSVASGRISYVLGLQGPSLSLDTACSSSLVATHLACQSLRDGECDMALAGGVNVILSPENTIAFSKSHMLAPDGRCKTFDASADGFVEGEGCGIVVLRRLSDAQADGDHILALIRGSAVNQDGASSGLTAPNGPAQEAVIRKALANSGVEPADVGYVEAHGTGTSLGDPIEVRALGAVLKAGRPAGQPFYLGSVKTNIGHLEAAAGVAGLIKVVLALQHKEIPPHLHLQTPSPYIPWAEIPAIIPTTCVPWPAVHGSRIAGLSSFGFSGTNVHLVIQEAPAVTPAAIATDFAERPAHVLCLSAKSSGALRDLAGRYTRHLQINPSECLPDVCFSANRGRAHFSHRLALVTESTSRACDELSDFYEGAETTGLVSGDSQGASAPRIAFLFTGQGAQYADMGKRLYLTQPIFRATLDRCDEILRPYLEHSLLSVLYSGQSSATASVLLNETVYTQPALFALEYALAELWRTWGIRPGAVMGHSVGEYVAACVAGVFSLEDGLKLISARARLMQALPRGGEMAAIFADPACVAQAIEPYATTLSIAALNGPDNVVVSGARADIEAVLDGLAAQGVKSRRLNVSHAFHSPLMEPMLDAFERVAGDVTYASPQLRLLSNVTGSTIGADAARPDYWRRHVRAAVQFEASMHALRELGYGVFVEAGPTPTLLGMGRRCMPEWPALWLPSLRPGQDDWSPMLTSLAALYVRGADVDWAGFDRDYSRRRLPLPTYPFQCERFWIDMSPRVQQDSGTRCKSTLSVDDVGVGHPLLGHRLRSPLAAVQFEAVLSTAAQAILADHRVFGQSVMPAAAYIEMALAAAHSQFGAPVYTLEDLVIHEALVVGEDQRRICQTVLNPQDANSASFQILSLRSGESDWQLHASGKVRGMQETAAIASISLAETREHCSEPRSAADHYCRLESQGLVFGPSTRSVLRIWRRPEGGEALAEIQLPEMPAADQDAYRLPPALLDGCLQLVAAALPDDCDTYLPVHAEQLTLYARPGTHLWGHAELQPVEKRGVSSGDGQMMDALTGHLQLLNDAGQIVVQVRSIHFKHADRAALARTMQSQQDQLHGDWLYNIQWQPKPLGGHARVDGDGRPAGSGRWLILTDKHGAGRQLATALEARGDSCILAVSGDQYHIDSDGHWQLDPARPEHFAQMLRDVCGCDAFRGVVHLWSLDAAPLGESEEASAAPARAQDTQMLSSASAFHLAQAMLTATWPGQDLPQLWLVTRNAQPVSMSSMPVALSQAPVWGLGSTIAVEHPELHCVQVDLDPIATPGEINLLCAEIRAGDQEPRVAFRQGERYVARLAHVMPAKGSWDRSQHLVNTSPGRLDGLALRPLSRRQPGHGEVEIRVYASGLNFRDVMNGLALREDPEPLGSECSGRIVRVGDGVSGLMAGDDVIAIATGSFSTFAIARAELTVRKPAPLSFAEAATLPLAFLTAHYALNRVAGMSPGERVLIHAASGGVGLAAVRLAQRARAEIFATAGSPTKRAYLESLGVQHVMNSRTLDFATEIKSIAPDGVHVILNSLAGEFIPHSLSVLAEDGKFIEIGKRDIWSAKQVSDVKPHAVYSVVDLSGVITSNPNLVQQMLQEMIALIERGEFEPLPMQVFGLEDAPDAFRYMAQARHMGKIVLTQPVAAGLDAENVGDIPLTPNGTYLITGGLGGLGLCVGRWLVQHGARHLMLIGRSEPTDDARATIRALEQAGAQVIVKQADVSDAAQVRRVIGDLARAMPPLRGIFHAAAVLDDGAILQQDWSRFRAVMAPKMDGAWYLHALTREMPLDFFVLFSSVASLLGSPGQANYASANAFLDALAHYRHAHGLTGLSINWGAWSQVGIAVRHHVTDNAAARGIGVITPEQGTQILGHLLGWDLPQVGVLPFNWQVFAQRQAAGAEMALLMDVVRSSPQSNGKAPALRSGDDVRASEWRRRLIDAVANGRRGVLSTFVQEQVARVLAIAPSKLSGRTPLSEMGLDSLMAIELRNLLGSGLGLTYTLPATLAFEYPTIELLVNYLTDQVLPRILTTAGQVAATADPAAAGPNSADAEPTQSVTVATALDAVEELSDEEVDRLLEARARGQRLS